MLETLTCGSWLVYATRAEHPNAVRIRDIVIAIKRDQIEFEKRRPYVELVVERMASELGPELTEFFGNGAVLVPVPGAGLTRPKTVWPALSICNALLRSRLGSSLATILYRAHAVTKSAGSQSRPSLDEHYESLVVQGTLERPKRLLVVDDVVTTGTTLMAGARRLNDAFPKASIAAFALARVHSSGESPDLFGPEIERIVLSGSRCRREPRPSSGMLF